jgi:GcrA cell cycle regulator
MAWTQELHDQLRKLWTEGHSTAEIGRRLNVSKNSIVGKAHRMELDGRPSPIRRDPSGASPPPASRLPPAPLPPLPSLAALPPAPPPAPVIVQASATMQPSMMPNALAWHNSVPFCHQKPMAPPAPAPVQTVAPRRTRECQWPIGEPGNKMFRLCCDTALNGKPYCAEHAKRAYVRIRDHREDHREEAMA